jgi:hypothetical protein
MCAAVAVLFLSAAGLVWAAEDEGEKPSPEKPSVEEAMRNIAKLGPGVHAIKTDKKGRILSCVVVGQARISTVLGKSKGIEMARDKANLAASAEFVKWLKEEVSVHQANEEEAVMFIEGSEDNDEDALKESGKSVEKNSKKMESVAKGLVRGLQVLHKEVDGDGKTYTVVKGWKADTAQGVKKVAADLASDEPPSKEKPSRSSGTTKDAADKPTKPRKDKDIESDSATSKDAADFLP